TKKNEDHEEEFSCTRISSCASCRFVPSWFPLSCGSPEDAQRRVAARSAHDAAARMRGRSAHPQIANRRRVLRPPGNRAREEQLLERQLALEDVAFREPELALEVERRQNLPVQDDV